MSDYYTASNAPATSSSLSSATIRAEFAAISAGFDKIIDLSSNANKLVKVNAGGTAQTASIISDDGSTATIAGALSTSGAINKVTITAPDTGSTLTIANGKTLTASNTLTLVGTDGTTLTFPSTSATIARTDAAQTFTGVQTFTSPAINGTVTTTGLTLPAFTLGGTVTSNGRSFSGTIANLGTVTTVDINGGTIDGTTQASGTINGPIAAGGTWTAAATWTLPALTLGGNVSSTGNPSLNIGTGALTAGSGVFSDDVTIANTSKLKNATTPSRDYLTVATNALTLAADANTIVWDGSAFYPGNNNIRTNGSATNRWANVYTANLDASGNVTLGDASTDTVTVNGYMGIGGAGVSYAGIYVRNSALVGTTQVGVDASILATSAATVAVRGVQSYLTLANGAYTISDVEIFRAWNPAATTATITNLHGLKIDDQTRGTNNYGITIGVTAGTNKYSIYTGTAQSYFGGNVGIGTSSPTAKLDVRRADSGVSGPVIEIGDVTAGSSGRYGGIGFSATAPYPVQLWGDALSFMTGSSTYASATERIRIDSAGHGLAGTDNTQTWGTAAKRWSVIYAGTGTINTSDAREKTVVRPLTAAEINAAKQLSKEVGAYRWLASVEQKGDAAREHIGLTVQRAIEIMLSNDLDPMAYGFICYDQWDDQFVEHPAIEAVAAVDAVVDDFGTIIEPAVEAVDGVAAWTEQVQVAGDRYSFRMDELNLFLARGFEARLAALEAK